MHIPLTATQPERHWPLRRSRGPLSAQPFRAGPCGSWAWLVAVAVTAAGPLAAAPVVSPEEEKLFEEKVRPLLVARCLACHGAQVSEGGLRLDNLPAARKGGDSGPALSPGDPAGSRLVAAVRRSIEPAMPPDEPLSAEEVAILEAWISAGIPWSGPGADGPVTTAMSADAVPSDMEARLVWAQKRHWAYRPIERHSPPEVPAGLDPLLADTWQGTIDRFIAAPLVAAGLQPGPEAAPRDLVRRLWFDLTGLPPPADRSDAYCANPGDEAFRALVDELLASPEHAEHWARHWLDLARYADTMGYAFGNQDPRYPFAWTYRDWVVGALAADVPYDRFVTLQLAADRIEPPVPPSDLAALGFLTVGRTFLGNQHDIIDDRIDLVTRGLLGLTVACGRCHDHKYEPVTAADYYGLYGIFASSHMPGELPVIGAAPPGAEADAFAAKLAELKKAIPAHEEAVRSRGTRAAIAHAADYFFESARPTPRKGDNRPPRLADDYDLLQVMLDRVARGTEAAGPNDPVLGPWVSLKGKTDEEFAAASLALLAAWGESPAREIVNPLLVAELRSPAPTTLRDLADAYGRLVARVAPDWAGGPAQALDEPAELSELRARLGSAGTPLVVQPGEAMVLATIEEGNEHRRRKMEVTRHEAEAAGAPPQAMVMLDRETPTDSHVLIRGNPGRPGELVERRLPKLLGGAPAARTSSGRLDLARGIVDPHSPLAPRLVVNWVWAHHIGRGIVEPPGDLGLRGELPSHPQLLDDLARRFVDEGKWSLRWLHREIVTSRAWRQSASIRTDQVDSDPDNTLLSHANRRRLGWEAWRDSLLVAAGALDQGKRGGRGMNPLAPDSMHRRTLYTRLDRQDVPGILRVFDVANPDAAVHSRSRTSVPQQSLAALNAPLAVDAARMVAARSLREAGAEAQAEVRIQRLWRACLSRAPQAEELAAAREFLAAAPPLPVAGAEDFGPWEQLAQAVLASSEFQFVD